jgi:hypothetical protein
VWSESMARVVVRYFAELALDGTDEWVNSP